MKKILSFLIFFLVISCDEKKDKQENNPVLSFQNQIIQEGLTGSNAAMIFKNGKVIYNQIANSSAMGEETMRYWSTQKKLAEIMTKATED